jgi:hypothetical protein
MLRGQRPGILDAVHVSDWVSDACEQLSTQVFVSSCCDHPSFGCHPGSGQIGQGCFILGSLNQGDK